MAPAFLDLKAPNGVKYSQPTGLFINNEFVESATGGTITSIDPAYMLPVHISLLYVSLIAALTLVDSGPRSRSRQYRPLAPRMSTGQ